MSQQATTTCDLVIYDCIRELMDNGATVKEAREKLRKLVDKVCDEIERGDDVE